MIDKKEKVQDVIKNNNVQEQKKEVTNVNSSIKPAKVEVKKPTYEELQKRIEILEKESEKKPKNIDDVIKFFELKKKKITQLEILKSHLGEIKEAKEITEKGIKENEFEKAFYQLAFKSVNEYSRAEPLFNISNSFIILNFCEFLVEKVGKRIAELEEEIKKDF